MKVSNGAVWSLFDSQLGEPVISELSNAKLTTSTSYKRMKNFKVLQGLQNDIAEAREEIIKKYGEEKDGVFSISASDEEARQNFFDDFNEILQKEEEADIKQFNISELDGRLDLSNQEFVVLSFMIEGMEE